MLPTVTVIIPVRDGAAGLALCLAALARQTYPRELLEVIVVDNGSIEDLSLALPADQRFTMIREDRPGSYAARNAGLARATGAVLAFTDGDCVPVRDWISAGVEQLSAEPRPDAIGGAINVTFPRGRPSNGPQHFEDVQGFPQRRYVEELNFSATANLMVWREAFNRVGLFDAGLRSGGDLNWGRRLVAGGGSLRYCEGAVVDHPARETWGELGRKTIRVAQGLADQRAEHDRTAPRVVRDVVHEVRTAVSIWWRVWQQPRPEGARAKAQFAAATSYVRLLRARLRIQDGIRSRGAATAPRPAD
ncbi:glycosyltransferase [Pengzhenrongella frigida]|nr:glycosyltransferase [Cellulomonas sp. HLT2-17]